MYEEINLKWDKSVDGFYNLKSLEDHRILLINLLKEFKPVTLSDYDEMLTIQTRLKKVERQIKQNYSENMLKIINFEKRINECIMNKIKEMNKNESTYKYLPNFIIVQPENLPGSFGYHRFENSLRINDYRHSISRQKMIMNLVETNIVPKDFDYSIEERFFEKFLNLLGLSYSDMKTRSKYQNFNFSNKKYLVIPNFHGYQLENFRDELQKFKFEVNIKFNPDNLSFIFKLINLEGNWQHFEVNDEIKLFLQEIIGKNVLLQFTFANPDIKFSHENIFYF